MFNSLVNSSSSTASLAAAYLNGGGEMGRLISNYDWPSTPLGPIDQWPQSLLTTVGIVVNSKFPMFLFWGEDNICFYNDAYRPSLGVEGKHPAALGQKAIEVWPEIWDSIGPFIGHVMDGGDATWSQDQLLPIFRNGRLENVYWTYSYSPVIGENGLVAGVFVTCVETTSSVENNKSVEENEYRYRTLIEEATVATGLYEGPDLHIQYANQILLDYWGKDRSVFGKKLSDAMPELEGQPFLPILKQVYNTGQPYVGVEEEAMLMRDGRLQPCYYSYTYKPLRNKAGEIYAIHHTAVEVTEQVLSRRKMIEAEQTLSLALKSAALGVYEVDYATNNMLADDNFNKIWGFDKAAPREAYAALIHPDDEWIRMKAHEEAIFSGQLSYEARIIWKDGTLHWVRVNGKVEFDEEAKPKKLIGVVQDVTEQLMAQHKTIESERNLRNIILQAPVAMCIFRGVDFVVETANHKMYELWGRSETEILHHPIFEALPEARQQGLEEILAKVFNDGEVFTALERQIILPRNGRTEKVFINFTYQPLRDGNGDIDGVLAVANDVSQSVIARQQIEDAEQRTRLAIETAELGIFEKDLVSRHLVSDERLLEIFGVPNLSTIDELEACIIEEDRGVRQKAFEVAALTGFVDYDVRIRLYNGLIRWIKIRGNVFFDDFRQPVKVVGVIQDITEQKQFAETLEKKVNERTKELAEANFQLQQSNVELNQFAYIASHDLQEPLRKVRTFTNMMASTLQPMPDMAAVYMQKIEASTERMQVLINDVLRFSLLSKEREKFSVVDLSEVVKEVLSDYELLIEQKDARIALDPLPHIEAIPLQMNQLFTNLLSNALKFSPPGRQLVIQINAKLAARETISQYKELNEEREHYQFDVADNGIGFNQAYAQQIFTIFQRLHGKKEYTGTGIGLAMCKKIILNHHGTIFATSAPGKGAVFTFFLPKSQSQK